MSPLTRKNRRIAAFWATMLLIAIVPCAGRAAGPLAGKPTAIPDVLVYADANSYDGAEIPYAVIVDKSRQQIRWYGKLNRWRTIAKWPCSTGKQSGPKSIEGDRKTPVGVYFAVRKIDGQFLSDTYGSQALPLDYPNVMDRSSARSGSAIWLHGTNKPLRPRDSNGCVVIENHVIDQLACHIRINRTPVIIVERIHLWPEKTARRIADRILSAADRWLCAVMDGDYQEFRRSYALEAMPSMQWWNRWCRYRRKPAAEDRFQSVMRHRAIYRSGRHYVLLFDQYLKDGALEVWAGCRKLYFAVEEDCVAIVAEALQAAPDAATDPLFSAWQKLWKKSEQRSRMAATQISDADL